MVRFSRFVLLVVLCVAGGPLSAAVTTSFDEGVLHPRVELDVPDPALARFELDEANEELDVETFGNTDLWTGRSNAPFAWTSRPPVGLGDTWFVETEIRYETDVLSSRTRVAGITFYGGPDGAGGSSQGMDFTFGINNWDDRGEPGYQAAVEVQGLGDNAPGDAGGNLTALWSSPSAFLRVEITENGASDAYTFYYKASEGDSWTLLGSFNSTVDNSRATLFFKNSGSTSAADRMGAFTYFNVGLVDTADLSITKSADSERVALGDTVTYTITVSNDGSENASNVLVTDVLPEGMNYVSSSASQGSGCTETEGTVFCELGTIADGDSAAVTIVVEVMELGSFENTASASSDFSDADGATATAAVVEGAATDVPAADPVTLALLAIALAIGGAVTLRR
ncbi:MAG TPA: DUF11 domain-containing protein [Thermoanaerobaculia bacterium]|nr:DUF11 domain-containing protein [Thermoanaerobaculia bacterium]